MVRPPGVPHMLNLALVIPVINFLLICAIGSLLFRDRRCHRRAEERSTSDWRETRAVADQAASDAKSCADVLDRLGSNGQRKRSLYAVRDEKGRSSWHFE